MAGLKMVWPQVTIWDMSVERDAEDEVPTTRYAVPRSE
jgi:hypothetical protein